MATNDPSGNGPGASSEKRPYEKPAVAWEEHMDARPGLMAGCNKVGGQGDPSCDAASAS
jgi:hypothetical protein